MRRGLLPLLTAAALWAAAFGWVTLARLWASVYREMGGDLPVPATLVIDAARWHAPWIAALLGTLLLVFLLARRNARLHSACALLAAVGLIVFALAAVGLALPISKCGVIWPDWPEAGCVFSPDTGRPIT